MVQWAREEVKNRFAKHRHSGHILPLVRVHRVARCCSECKQIQFSHAGGTLGSDLDNRRKSTQRVVKYSLHCSDGCAD